jgi:pyruvate/2-oxoglutarate dehydrogenase complex dihydrolipoamide dehydrogenase (E3) component
VRERKRAIVDQFRNGNQKRLESAPGLELLFADARFTGERTVEAGGRVFSADTVFINTGGRPAAPKVAELESVGYLDSTSIMELDLVPEHLLVLGGGYVGLEFAQMFRRFGSEVTVVQRDSQLLPQEDADIAGAVLEILRDDGIEVLLRTEARCATRDGEGLKLEVTAADGPRILRGTHVLVATGRVPNTDRLNLGAAGVRTDARGFVIVNERLETTASGVYALGDVKGGPAFTHISYDDFRIVRTNLLQGGNATTTGRLVPYTVFLDPQLGRVGLSEREAVKQGRDHRVVKMPMTRVARALEVDESRGVMKALVDPGSGRLLGAAVLGLEGGELMSMLQLAIMGNLRYSDLRDAVFAHPTLAESFNNLFSVLED